jgi:hypothetical protein
MNSYDILNIHVLVFYHHKHHSYVEKKMEINSVLNFCRNLSLGLVTKARAYKVVGQEEARE